MSKKSNPHRGTNLDDLLDAEGVLDEFQAAAVKEVIAWQIQDAMKREQLTKTAMAARMNTSRAQLNRLLDPKDEGVTLHTLQKAAAILGRDLKIELI